MTPIDEAIEDLKWALEELDHTKSDDDYDRVMKELAYIQRLADKISGEEYTDISPVQLETLVGLHGPGRN